MAAKSADGFPACPPRNFLAWAFLMCDTCNHVEDQVCLRGYISVMVMCDFIAIVV